MKNAHEPIIEEEKFEQAQAEMKRRSNIEIDIDGTRKRKSTHYSAKQNTDSD